MAKQHRGEVVRDAVLKSGVKITRLYQLLGISRPTLYRRFDEPHLAFDFIEQVGALIRHDFSQDFRELVPPAPPAAASVVAEPAPAYQLDSLDDCKNKLLHVYGLYTELQEKYNALLAERSRG